LLGEYELVIYSADKDVSIAAELLTEKKGLSVSILESEQTSHDEILSYHGKARISIGLSISDGISTSLLEALAMGSFPIQSWTSCAEEWIVDGKTGILVHPEDPDEVEKALRLVLLDDNLVDNAATVNQKLAQDQLGYEKIEQMIVEQYKSINNPENGDSSSSKR
jgi:glycosyltransferase involved in cell wall biosynthesis